MCCSKGALCTQVFTAVIEITIFRFFVLFSVAVVFYNAYLKAQFRLFRFCYCF